MGLKVNILIINSHLRESDLVFSRKPQSILMSAILTLALTGAPSFDKNYAFAGSTNSDVRINAVVPIKTEISYFFQVPIIILTDSDMRRGYIDIQGATRLSIKNNNKAGYVLLFEGLGRPFKEVLIYGLAYDVQINTAAAFVHQPYYSNKIVSAQLSYRFFLSDDADAGEYLWPLSISIQPAF